VTAKVYKSAVISDCKRYRYCLYRSWGDGPFVVFLMFNPSTADAEVDDPTIRKCIGFAQRWGYPGLAVVNLFALRSTDPKAIARHLYDDAVGIENDSQILTACTTATQVVAAWGCGQHLKSHSDRPAKVIKLIRGYYPKLELVCLGRSKDGSPRHPLMLPYTTERQTWPIEGNHR